MSGFPEVTDEQARYAIRRFNIEAWQRWLWFILYQVKFNRYAARINSDPAGDRVAGYVISKNTICGPFPGSNLIHPLNILQSSWHTDPFPRKHGRPEGVMLRYQSKGLGESALRKLGDETADSSFQALLVRNGIQSVGKLVYDHIPLVGDGVQVFARRDVNAGFVEVPLRGSAVLVGKNSVNEAPSSMTGGDEGEVSCSPGGGPSSTCL